MKRGALFLIGPEYFANCRIHQMYLPTRQASDRLVSVSVVRDLLSDEALDRLAGSRTAVKERRQT